MTPLDRAIQEALYKLDMVERHPSFRRVAYRTRMPLEVRFSLTLISTSTSKRDPVKALRDTHELLAGLERMLSLLADEREVLQS